MKDVRPIWMNKYAMSIKTIMSVTPNVVSAIDNHNGGAGFGQFTRDDCAREAGSDDQNRTTIQHEIRYSVAPQPSPSERVVAVLVNYNGGDMNVAAIDSLIAERCGAIIVMDNASTDGSLERLAARYGEQIHLVRQSENVGFARACNAGAALTDHEYILFFNNDATACEGMVSTMLSAMLADPNIGIAGPVVLEATKPDTVQSTGYTIDRWGFPVDRTQGLNVRDLPEASVRDTFFVSGCALMVRRSVFEILLGFDERMFMFVEDVDLCWRTWLAGFRVVTLRGPKCLHFGGATAEVGKRDGSYRTSTFRIRERERNTIRSMLVNLNGLNLMLYIFFFLPITIIEPIIWLILGRVWVCRGYFDGFLLALHDLPDTLIQRRNVRRTRRCPDTVATRQWSIRYEKLFFALRNGVPSAARSGDST